MTSVIDITADELRNLRYRLGWSQAEMARCLKLDVLSISGFETGTTPIPLELKSSLVRIMFQAEANVQNLQRRPIAEVVMREKNLSQVHAGDCQFDIVSPTRRR